MPNPMDVHRISNPRTTFSRRGFLMAASAALAEGLPLAKPVQVASPARGPFTGKLCFFSKALPHMDWRRLAQSVKRMGFTGVDLTVRGGGHVKPERAAEDLPKAVAMIREEGLAVPMITTELVSASDPTARPILSTAARLSIPFYKPGYYMYDFSDVRRELKRAGEKFLRLVDLGKEYGIEVGYHNHEGYIGAPVWDMARVIDTLDPKWAGYYFDVRHAVAEGGDEGWKIATNLVASRLKMVAIKDFYWEKTATKGWTDQNCPLGQGMVRWKEYFSMLGRSNFQGPISLHLEYEIPGDTIAAKERNTLRAAQRDLEFLKARLREGYATISSA